MVSEKTTPGCIGGERRARQAHIINGSPKQIAIDAKVSTHQRAQATDFAQFPQIGTHTKMNMLTNVANPIGAVPRKSDCRGCSIISCHTAGYRMYRSAVAPNMETKSIMFRTNTVILISCSQEEEYVVLISSSRMATIPVPIVTENYNKALVTATNEDLEIGAAVLGMAYP